MTYASTILADTPQAWYRLGDLSGLVAVDSSGNGTRFTIVLPRTQPVRTGARETPPASVPIIRTALATGSAS